MSGSLDAFLKSQPIKLQVTADTSSIESELKSLNDKFKIKVGVDIGDASKDITKAIRSIQSTIKNSNSKVKINVELNSSIGNINTQLKALEAKIQSAKSIKPIKLDVDFNATSAVKNLTNQINNINSVIKKFDGDINGNIKNISKNTNEQFSNIINKGTTQRVVSELNNIKNEMRNMFGDGIVDTRVLRDSEENIRRISATITKSTGEIITRMYDLQEESGKFEFIKQTDVDKVETQTNKIKNSMENLRNEVNKIFSQLGSESKSFELFNKMEKADIVSTEDLSELKQLISSEKEAIAVSEKLAQAQQLIATAMSKVNPEISNVTQEFKQLENSLDSLDSNGLDSVISKTKQLSAQYKNDEALFKQRAIALKNVQKMSDELARAELKMSTVGSRGSQNKDLMERARGLVELSRNSITTATSVGQLKSAFDSLDSASNVFSKIKQNMSMDSLENDINHAVINVEKLMNKLVEVGRWDNDNKIRAFDDLANAIQEGLPAINAMGDRLNGQLREAQAEARELVSGIEMIGKATKNLGEIQLKENLLGSLKDMDVDGIREYIGQLENAKVRTVAVTNGLNAQGQAVYKVNAVMDGAGKIVKSYNYEIGQTEDALDSFINKTNSSLRNNENKNLGFLEQMGIAMKRIPGYIVSMEGFYKAMQGIKSVAKEIMYVDKAMTELKRVASSNINIDTLFDKALVSSKNLGANIHDVLDALGEFSRTFGDFSENQLIAITETATVMSNVSDLSLGDSASSLVGTMNAFNITAEDSIRIVDSLNEVDNQYAISTSQLAQGLSKTGAVAKTFGVNMEEVVGHITAIGSVTMESGDIIGNSLKTIYSRMTTHKDARSAIESVGIALDEMTESGLQARNVGDIMGDLAGKWNTLTASQRQNIGVQIAGRNHLTRFLALMNNWGTATEATATAMNAQGSAMREQQAYMQSYEAKVNGLKTRFTELSLAIGKAFMDDGMMSGMNALAGLMEGFTQLTTKVGALPLVFGTATTAISLFLKTKEGFSGFGVDTLIQGFSKLTKYVSGQGVPAMEKMSKAFRDVQKNGEGSFGKGLVQSIKNMASATKSADKNMVSLGKAGSSAGIMMATGFNTAKAAAGSFIVGLGAIAVQIIAVMAVGAAIGYVIEKMTEASAKSNELKQRYAQQQETALEAYNKAGNSFDAYLKRYDELSKKMANQKLGTEELEEYNRLQNEIAAIMPNSIKYVDQQGQAHLKTSASVHKEADAVRELAKERAKLANQQFDEKLEGDNSLVNSLYGKYSSSKSAHEAGGFTSRVGHYGISQEVFNKYNSAQMSKFSSEMQDSMQQLSMVLNENSISIGDNVVAWNRASGNLKNVSTTAQSAIQEYAKVNQYTIEEIEELRAKMGKNTTFGDAWISAQNKLESKTQHFANAMVKSYDKFDGVGENVKEELIGIFDTIVSSMDLEKFGGDTSGLENYFSSIAENIAKVGKDGEVNIGALRGQLIASGMSAIEAEKYMNALAIATENESLKAAIAAGEITDYGNALDDVSEVTYNAIDATKEFFGIISEQASAVNSHLSFLEGMRNLSPQTWLADDRVQESITQIADMTGLSKNTIVDNFDEINGAFTKFSQLSGEQIATIGQSFLENGEEWNKLTEGMSDSTKDLFGRMLQYVTRGGVDMTTAMRIAMEGIGKVSEEAQQGIEDTFKNVTNIDPSDTNFDAWKENVSSGLSEMANEFNVVTDASGKTKLQLLDGSSSPFLDTINKQVETLGLTYKTSIGEDGKINIEIVDANGNSVGILSELNGEMLEGGMAAALLEDAYRDLTSGQATLSEFFQRSATILASTGEGIEVFEGHLRAVGETTETQKKALSEFNNSLDVLGYTIKNIDNTNGKMTMTVVDSQGNELQYVVDEVGNVVAAVENVNGKHGEATVDITTNTEQLQGAEGNVRDTAETINNTRAELKVQAISDDDSSTQARSNIEEVVTQPLETEVKATTNTENLEVVRNSLLDLISNSEQLKAIVDTVVGVIDVLLGKNDSLSTLQTTLSDIQTSADSLSGAIDTLLEKLSTSINFGGGFDGSVFDDIREKVSALSSSLDTLSSKMSNIGNGATSNINLPEIKQQDMKAPKVDYSSMINSQKTAIKIMQDGWESLSSTSVQIVTSMGNSLQKVMADTMVAIALATSVGAVSVTAALTLMSVVAGAVFTSFANGMKNSFTSAVDSIVSKAYSIGGSVAAGINSNAWLAARAMSSLAQGMIDAFNVRLNSFDFAGAASRIASMIAMSDSQPTDIDGEDVNQEEITGLFNHTNQQYSGIVGGFSGAMGETLSYGSGEAMSGVVRNSVNISHTFSGMAEENKLEDLYKRDTLELLTSKTQSFINKANEAMKNLTKNTLEYRNQLFLVQQLNTTLQKQENEKLKQTLDRQKQIERELLGLQNTASHTEEQRKKYNELQKEFDENTKEIWKLEESIQSLNTEIKEASVDAYLDYIEEIQKEWEDTLSSVSDEVTKLSHELEILELQDDSSPVEQMKLQARLREQSLVLEKTYANQVAKYQLEYTNALNKYGKDSEQLKAVKEQLLDAEENYRDEQLNGLKIEKDIRDTREEIAEENVKNIQSYYKKMEDLSSKAIKKEKDELKKLHDEKNKMYDEEIDRINEIYNTKLDQLNASRDEEEHTKKINEYNSERSELMKQISLASRDNSLEGQKKLKELQEELLEVNENLAQYQKDRQDEQYRDAIKKQQEEAVEKIKLQKEAEAESYDLNVEALDNKLEQIAKYYDAIINDDAKWAEITKKFKDGDSGAFGELVKDMEQSISELMVGNGSSIMGAEGLSAESLKEILQSELTDISGLWYNISDGIGNLNDIQNEALDLTIKNQDGKNAKNPTYQSSSSVISSNMPTTSQNSVTPNNKVEVPNVPQDGIRDTYTVARGDTLWDIAKKYYGDYYKWKKIQLANGGIDPYKLPIGKKLIIPFRSGGFVNKLTLNSFNCWELLVS